LIGNVVSKKVTSTSKEVFLGRTCDEVQSLAVVISEVESLEVAYLKVFLANLLRWRWRWRVRCWFN